MLLLLTKKKITIIEIGCYEMFLRTLLVSDWLSMILCYYLFILLFIFYTTFGLLILLLTVNLRVVWFETCPTKSLAYQKQQYCQFTFKSCVGCHKHSTKTCLPSMTTYVRVFSIKLIIIIIALIPNNEVVMVRLRSCFFSWKCGTRVFVRSDVPRPTVLSHTKLAHSSYVHYNVIRVFN